LIFAKIDDYNFQTHGFSYSAQKTNSMTVGELYTFRYRALNQLGWSEFSDTITVALGSLPSQVSALVKADHDNSET
jgi:hypothetical protein